MAHSTLDFPRPTEISGSTSNETTANPPAEFVEIDGTRFVCIHQLEALPTFFLTMVSASNHWLFAATNGSLSAGRGSPETALFPYYTVDKIIDNWNSTGPQTYIQSGETLWEPFKPYTKGRFTIEQRIFKSINGDVVIFEESNLDLGLSFRYRWQTSEKYGFIRTARLTNSGDHKQTLRVVDGISNFMAAGVDSRTQQEYSCLTDAYKLSERDPQRQLLVHRMAATLTDEAVPLESLRATTVWSHGWPESEILILDNQVEGYLKRGQTPTSDTIRAGRGAFYNAGQIELVPAQSKEWSQIAEIDQDQSAVAALVEQLNQPKQLWTQVQDDVIDGMHFLDSLIAASDGQQVSAEEIVTTHHRANVLFNIMRGGVFPNGYSIETKALRQHIRQHRIELSSNELQWLDQLPDQIDYPHLIQSAHAIGETELQRICSEYLPLTFSRRHGDPSRPWNRFTIQTKDESGNDIVGFQGNWRDIFQNWEALAWSFPLYNEAFIHKFLNASTADGYNPYRITADGVDWEEPDPTDPWASIGYWGDHQIIYLLKLLEFSEKLDAKQLKKQLSTKDYVFADVPYEIKPFAALERDPNHSIHFNVDRNEAILKRAKTMGADGKLLHNNQQLVKASMLEKLLIPLAVKLSNFMPGGGIWMNTQRPEWNDANNALAGNGLSMVTTYYLHRYLNFLDRILDTNAKDFECSEAVSDLIDALAQAFSSSPGEALATSSTRYRLLKTVGLAGENYRQRVYSNQLGKSVMLSVFQIKSFIQAARAHLRASIDLNKRPDGLYHAYNILELSPEKETASVQTLGPMLEGQVAILSSEAIDESEALNILQALPKSSLYCARRKSYILYADKELPSFLNYNRVCPEEASSIPTLKKLLQNQDHRLLHPSSDGCLRFRSHIRNRFELDEALDQLGQDSALKAAIATDRSAIQKLYETTFNHHSFTGRSGSMFAYEGLGSIYWHMVSKLMLATQEWALQAKDDTRFDQFRKEYYQIQNGLGFRKTPSEYGAFPADAYSHTPAHAGAQQPGLTGMVKEGVICRFAELGVELNDQTIRFNPRLLRAEEFLSKPVTDSIRQSDGSNHTWTIPEEALLFTFAQTPIIYQLVDTPSTTIKIQLTSGESVQVDSNTLPEDWSREILFRTNQIHSITVHLPQDSVFC